MRPHDIPASLGTTGRSACGIITDLADAGCIVKQRDGPGIATRNKEAGNMTAADVWVAKDDGSDIIRAAAIAAVGRDYNGNITVRLSGSEQTVVTLVHRDAPDSGCAPDDFHRQLLKVATELSHTAEPAIVLPVFDAERGWRWHTEHL